MAEKILFKTELTDYSTATLGDTEGVGVKRYDEKGNEYRWVKNAESAAFVAGQTVMYDETNAGSALFDSVVDDATGVTADIALFAGIAMSAIPTLGFGWIMISGYYATAIVDEPGTTAIAVGNALICSGANNYLGYGAAQGTAPTYPNHCLALEAVATATPATASTTTIKVLVRGQ